MKLGTTALQGELQRYLQVAKLNTDPKLALVLQARIVEIENELANRAERENSRGRPDGDLEQ